MTPDEILSILGPDIVEHCAKAYYGNRFPDWEWDCSSAEIRAYFTQHIGVALVAALSYQATRPCETCDGGGTMLGSHTSPFDADYAAFHDDCPTCNGSGSIPLPHPFLGVLYP